MTTIKCAGAAGSACACHVAGSFLFAVESSLNTMADGVAKIKAAAEYSTDVLYEKRQALAAEVEYLLLLDAQASEDEEVRYKAENKALKKIVANQQELLDKANGRESKALKKALKSGKKKRKAESIETLLPNVQI